MLSNNIFSRTNIIKNCGVIYLILSLIFSILSLLLNHMMFGMLGVASGLIAYKEGYSFGAATSGLSVAFMLLGLLLSTFIESYFKLLLNVFMITG